MDRPLDFTCKFSAGSAVDVENGVLRGVTVAEIGQASGHYVFLDKNNIPLGTTGSITEEKAKLAVRKLPLCMDAQSLLSVVSAGKAAGRVKVREDHDDDIGSRAGYVDNFRIEGEKVVCDQYIFPNYANRGIYFDAAVLTPELIGLSGDFKFRIELQGDLALMRVLQVDAVDIVDQGALTHAGLFRATKVDMEEKAKAEANASAHFSKTYSTMADTPAPSMGDEFSKVLAPFIKTISDQNAACMAKFDELFKKLSPPTAAPAADDDDDSEDSEMSALKVEFSALKTEIAKHTKESNEKIVTLQKTFSALGVNSGTAPQVSNDAPLTPSSDQPKDFLTLKASIAKEKNLTATEATRFVIKNHPDVHAAYMKAKGITK